MEQKHSPCSVASSEKVLSPGFARSSSRSTARELHCSSMLTDPPLTCVASDFEPQSSFDRRVETESGATSRSPYTGFCGCLESAKRLLKAAASDLLAGETDFAQIYRQAVSNPKHDNKLAAWNSTRLKESGRRAGSGITFCSSPLRYLLLRFADHQTEKEYELICNELCIVRFIFQLLIHHGVIMPILFFVFAFTGAHRDFRVYFPPLELFYVLYFSLAVGLGLLLALMLIFPGFFFSVGMWARKRALTVSYFYTFLMVTGYCMPFAVLQHSFPTPQKEIVLVDEDLPLPQQQAAPKVDAQLVNALLGTERVFVDTTLFSVYLFTSTMLWLDVLAPSLVRLTAVLHLWIPSAFSALFVIAYIYSHYVNPSALATVICLFYSLSLWSYAGRYATELQHRIVFLNWRSSRERLVRLVEQAPQPASNSTGADGMMIHLRQMDRTIKQLILLHRGTGGVSGQLEQLEMLVKELEDILRKNNDIYSVQLQDEDHGPCGTHMQVSESYEELGLHIGQEWNTNLIELEEQTSHSFFLTGYALLRTVISELGCPPDKLTSFLNSCEAQHQANPYHNRRHAAVVAHSTAWLANTLGVINNCDSVERAALHVSALCHDLGHPGRTNQFFVASYDPLAIVYNDIACLENLHCCLCFRTLERLAELRRIREENNIFFYLNNENFRFVRSQLIKLILATDMKQHFETISRFRLRKSADDFDVVESVDDRWAVLTICLKMGDISHVGLSWDMHFRLSCDIVEEFYQQGDEELRRGMSVSLLCDRSKHCEMPKSQEGFLEYLAKPLLSVLLESDISGLLRREVYERVELNLQRWKQMALDQVVVPMQSAVPQTQARTFTASALRRVAGVESTQPSPYSPATGGHLTCQTDGSGKELERSVARPESGDHVTGPAEGFSAPGERDHFRNPVCFRRPFALSFLARGQASVRKWTASTTGRDDALAEDGRPAGDVVSLASEQSPLQGDAHSRSPGEDLLDWSSLPFEATSKEAGPIHFTQAADLSD
ncbi:3 5 -cyclic nucleotide phosphodiesterase domain-containing protein, partial [Cystoisospora suis]